MYRGDSTTRSGPQSESGPSESLAAAGVRAIIDRMSLAGAAPKDLPGILNEALPTDSSSLGSGAYSTSPESSDWKKPQADRRNDYGFAVSRIYPRRRPWVEGSVSAAPRPPLPAPRGAYPPPPAPSVRPEHPSIRRGVGQLNGTDSCTNEWSIESNAMLITS